MSTHEPAALTGVIPTIPTPADPSPKVPATRTPTDSWAALRVGNDRFVAGEPEHPSQSVDRRRELASSQHPHTVIFGCSDSRVAAEIIFDQGLGDVFVVRTAGHVVDTTVIGSIEYGTELLGASLVVVLGHDLCGAIAATAHTLATGEQPPGFVRAVVDKVIPSVAGLTAAAHTTHDDGAAIYDPDVLRTVHVRHTVEMLAGYSAALHERIEKGSLAIVGVEYDLAEGNARLVHVLGDVGEEPQA
ncbi:carbonic anhydrase [Xylanimonas cellulosilytica DSM 15894]|uniref:carbonic anhydrase n=1 Tax=Xylanimonas cellulosilytica (strain DSM 15894 / JCM 12276 / CECT 5975 / KCTC 9989 / LMG 20990 / NBRC 107835 / XIL07) TaxID=446471 RepID=D1BYP2_XYLCX|nr:carbonic anhydrase [Xylanimonas cellulosilytica]ACZ29967.1 carbonic anhydrase [Xylanimonas cellulosilytica DSM 15894]